MCAGLSRSGSTWQYNALRAALGEALRRAGSAERVRFAHGHSVAEVEECLAHTYCVVKVHEMLPDVLVRVHAVFLTHRDLRDVLLSSAVRLRSCLLYGTQVRQAAAYAATLL